MLTKLQAVGLRGVAQLLPSELSTGVALARAIAMHPKMLFYDEPFIGLDPIFLSVVMRFIRTMNETLGVASVVVLHNVKKTAQIAHRSCLLANGRVITEGTLRKLVASDSAFVR